MSKARPVFSTNKTLADSVASRISNRLSNTETLGVVDFVYNILGFDKQLFLSQTAILKTICGEELNYEETELLTQWKNEGKTNWIPNNKWLEINLEVGMRSSKSTMAAFLAVYQFYRLLTKENPLEGFPRAAKGTTIFITTITTTEQQSKDTIFGYIKNYIEDSPWFQTLVAKGDVVVTQERVYSPTKNIVIYAGHSNGGALVGKGALFVLMDEVCRFVEATGSFEKVDGLVTSVRKSLTTFAPEAKIISISSVWETGDYMQYLIENGWEHADKGVLCFSLTTFDIRPDLCKTDPDITLEYVRNEVAAARDYESIRPKGARNFFDDDDINACMQLKDSHQVVDWIDGLTEDPMGNKYVTIDVLNVEKPSDHLLYSVGHADPAVSGDSYAFSVGHIDADEGLIYIDSIMRWAPIKQAGRVTKVHFPNVEQVIKQVCKTRNITLMTFDHFQAEGLIQQLNAESINAEQVFYSKPKQLQIYLLARRWIIQKRVVLPSTGPLVNDLRDELAHIQLVGTKLTHPKNYGKDLADAVCTVIASLAATLDLDEVLSRDTKVNTVMYKQPEQMNINYNYLKTPTLNALSIVRDLYKVQQ